MSEWSMKRFWTEVSVEEEAGGFAVKLDGRLVRTPAKRALIVPGQTMAENIAAEWDAQSEGVRPETMPWTRSANAALDKVATQRAEVETHLAGYAATDLLCYRAEGPEGLVALQAETWDPVLDWMESRFGVRLATTAGVMPVEQASADLAVLAKTMEPMTDFQLTGFHDLVTLSGSFGLALAAADREWSAEHLWSASRLDEEWQIRQWGEDEEASSVAALKKQAFLHATEVYLASPV